jgi:hypothetical protein
VSFDPFTGVSFEELLGFWLVDPPDTGSGIGFREGRGGTGISGRGADSDDDEGGCARGADPDDAGAGRGSEPDPDDGGGGRGIADAADGADSDSWVFEAFVLRPNIRFLPWGGASGGCSVTFDCGGSGTERSVP